MMTISSVSCFFIVFFLRGRIDWFLDLYITDISLAHEGDH